MEEKHDDYYRNQTKNQRDVQTQTVVSIALGLVAFLSFCVSLFPLKQDDVLIRM